LIAANSGKEVISYTHKPVWDEQDKINAPANRAALREQMNQGFTINLSGNNLAHADKLVALGIGPVVTVLTHWTDKELFNSCRASCCVCPRPNSR